MKANVFLKCITAALIAGAVVLACQKSDSNGNGGNNDGNEGPEEIISIDGNFEDWDAATDLVTAQVPDNAELKALKKICFTSDQDYIYGYAEFENHLKTLEGVDPSWDGNGSWAPGVPTPLCILIDCDANPKTGMIYKEASTSISKDGIFTNIGFEVGLDVYQFISVETGLVTFAWSQCNQFDYENASDGDAYGSIPPQKWGDDGMGNRDNTIMLRSDYAAKITGTLIKAEFAINRSTLYEIDGREAVNISVVFTGCDTGAKGSPVNMGYLPQGAEKEYLTINLK